MDVKSCAKLVVLMLVAVMALQASAAEANRFKTDRCKVKCLVDCAVIAKPKACYLTCFKNCIGNLAAVEAFGSRCDLDCMTSRCFDLHSDAKKVEGCVDSCSGNCSKS